MKICSPQLGLAPNSILGGEVFDREILLGLAKEGVEVEIILPNGKQYGKPLKNWRISFVGIPHALAVMYNIIFIPAILKAYFRRKIRIFRVHSPKYIGLGLIILKAFCKDMKLIATYHQPNESNFFFLSKIINLQWDHIVCDSERVKSEVCSKYNVDEKRVTVVHNGVPDYLSPQSKDKKAQEKYNVKNQNVLLYMGLFIDRKNPLFLLDVLEKILRHNQNTILIYVGKGPLEKEIVRKSINLGIDSKIRIIPPIFGKDKLTVLNLADIFVHPSLDEGFALAPLEAMACGTPVIMSNGHSAREAIDDGINGRICNLNDVDDWASGISRMLASRKMLSGMGKNSVKKVKKEFDWKIAVKKHISIIKLLENEAT